MLRRAFLQTSFAGIGAAVLTGCETPATPQAKSSARAEIDSAIQPTLDRLYREVAGSRETVSKAAGVLVFPSILKAGVGLGGEYGRGALRVANQPSGYYSISGGSLGIQLGAERRSVVALFMSQEALQQFRNNPGWTFGADASYATPQNGAIAAVNTAAMPLIVYVFGNSGLMFSASVQGSRVDKLDLG